MARPRKPNEIQELSGSWDKNPDRRRSEALTDSFLDINNPPDNMSEREISVWKEIVRNAPIRVLRNSDRFLVEAAARAISEMRFSQNLIPSQRNACITTVKGLLSLMGMTPADRSRVESGWEESKAANDDDEFRDEFKAY